MKIQKFEYSNLDCLVFKFIVEKVLFVYKNKYISIFLYIKLYLGKVVYIFYFLFQIILVLGYCFIIYFMFIYFISY